jgi:hypothetical protein
MAWFTFTSLTRITLARAEAVNAIFTAIQTALGYLGVDQTLFTGHRIFYAADTGAVNAYVVTLDPVPSAYVVDMTIDLVAANSNTAASTINVNGLGVKSITDSAAAALTAGMIVAGVPAKMIYDGTRFRLQATATTTTPGDGTVVFPARSPSCTYPGVTAHTYYFGGSFSS